MAKNEKKPLRHEYIAKVETDSEERTVTAVISTSAIDRDKEVLVPKGANLDNFRKNPVVLWAHDHSIPAIGKALHIAVKGKKIIAKVKFATTDFADEIFSLFKDGILNAFSVGFMPTKSHQPTPKEIAKNPELANAFRIFDEWELLEFSPVNVPANPEALATAVKSMSDEAKKAFGIEEDENEKGFWEDNEDNVYEHGDVVEDEDGVKYKNIDEKQVDKVAQYLEESDCILLDGNYAVTVADGVLEVEKIADQPAIEVKEVPIEIHGHGFTATPIDIKVSPVQIVATPVIDVVAVAVEEIKRTKGTMY